MDRLIDITESFVEACNRDSKWSTDDTWHIINELMIRYPALQWHWDPESGEKWAHIFHDSSSPIMIRGDAPLAILVKDEFLNAEDNWNDVTQLLGSSGIERILVDSPDEVAYCLDIKRIQDRLPSFEWLTDVVTPSRFSINDLVYATNN